MKPTVFNQAILIAIEELFEGHSPLMQYQGILLDTEPQYASEVQVIFFNCSGRLFIEEILEIEKDDLKVKTLKKLVDSNISENPFEIKELWEEFKCLLNLHEMVKSGRFEEDAPSTLISRISSEIEKSVIGVNLRNKSERRKRVIYVSGFQKIPLDLLPIRKTKSDS